MTRVLMNVSLGITLIMSITWYNHFFNDVPLMIHGKIALIAPVSFVIVLFIYNRLIENERILIFGLDGNLIHLIQGGDTHYRANLASSKRAFANVLLLCGGLWVYDASTSSGLIILPFLLSALLLFLLIMLSLSLISIFIPFIYRSEHWDDGMEYHTELATLGVMYSALVSFCDARLPFNPEWLLERVTGKSIDELKSRAVKEREVKERVSTLEQKIKNMKSELLEHERILSNFASSKNILDSQNPSVCMSLIRLTTEHILRKACEDVGITWKPNSRPTLDTYVKRYHSQSKLDSKIETYLDNIKSMGNRATHSFNIEWDEFEVAFKQFCLIVTWYTESHASN
tara:strand:+ start:353 stop:1381 length:1029 start_codon:yes stop_codon:yes gene_type:complete